MPRLAIVSLCALALLAGCGEDDEGGANAGTAPAAADLTVTVRPAGPDGPVRERRIECVRLGLQADEPACRRLADLTQGRLAPVPRLTPCTAIYGGPDLARVTGTLRGEPVDARFNLRNGCEIARWERNRDLLGPPRRAP